MKLLEVAETLFNDCKNLVSFSQSEVIKINSREEGYQVQDYFLEQKEKNGAGNIAGWKVALTNIEMQKLTGINEPAEGAIFEPLIYNDNAKIKLDNYVHLGAEAEIAIRIGKNISIDSRGFSNIDEMVPYVSEVMSALEIVDDRDYGREASLGILLGQNSMNYGCVLGEPTYMDPMKIDILKGSLLVNGEVFGIGSGKNVLGHPLKALMWLANSLLKRGRTLNTGDIVMTGSIATTCWPIKGDTVVADIEGLKPASLEVL